FDETPPIGQPAARVDRAVVVPEDPVSDADVDGADLVAVTGQTGADLPEDRRGGTLQEKEVPVTRGLRDGRIHRVGAVCAAGSSLAPFFGSGRRPATWARWPIRFQVLMSARKLSNLKSCEAVASGAMA